MGEEFGINGSAALLQAMREAIARWEEFAQVQGVTSESIAQVREELDQREAELRD